MGEPAVFLDRDGVIIEDIHHLGDPSQVALIPLAGEAIAQINRLGYPVVVVTNQAGVARGLYSESDVLRVHRHLDEVLKPYQAEIDRYYYCPHHPTHGIGAYRVDCECRKPRPGMLLLAAEEMGLDLPRSFMVGDKSTDLEAGLNAGCMPILVQTGYGLQEALDTDNPVVQKSKVFSDLYQVAKYLAELP